MVRNAVEKRNPDQSVKRMPFARFGEPNDFRHVLRVDAKSVLLAFVERWAIETGVEKFSQQSIVQADGVGPLHSRNKREDVAVSQFEQLVALMNCV